MNKLQFMAALALGALILANPATSFAQQEKLNPITLDLQDAGIRGVLEAAFKQAGINNYLIDNNVVGFVTLKVTEQPFENALKLIMRAASVPLTYTKENGVWIVKPRTITPPEQSQNQTQPDVNPTRPQQAAYERINLTYLDPMDLQMVLGGMTRIQFYTRFGGGGMGMGGMGGGMGGGGMMGGMGGGGMMGGGFGGFGR